MSDLSMLGGVTPNVEAMVVDSVRSPVPSVSVSGSSVSSSPVASSVATAITTSSAGGGVSVASSNNNSNMGQQLNRGQLQASGAMLSIPNNSNNNGMVTATTTTGGGGLHPGGVGVGSANTSSGHINEQAAISEIEKSLRQYETGGSYSGSPPAYPMHSAAPNKFLPGRGVGFGIGFPVGGNGMTVGLSNPNGGGMPIPNSGFPMPPNYPQRPPVGVAQQHQQQQRYQNMQRERLLQEQQKQQLVVTAGATNSGLNPGMSDISSLINNSVAPNVSLQRNNSVGARQAQLSPGFNANAFQQMSPGQTNRTGAPFSPVQMGKVPGSGQQQQGSGGPQQGPPPNYQAFPNSAEIQPMSPQFGSPEMMSMLSMGKPNAGNSGTVLAQQLSPRQPPFSSPQSAQQWTAQQLSLQQQQNPMLNAQLTVSGDWR